MSWNKNITSNKLGYMHSYSVILEIIISFTSLRSLYLHNKLHEYSNESNGCNYTVLKFIVLPPLLFPTIHSYLYHILSFTLLCYLLLQWYRCPFLFCKGKWFNNQCCYTRKQLMSVKQGVKITVWLLQFCFQLKH